MILNLFFSEPNLLVRACNQLGQFLTHRETNLRYLALESMCLLATSEFSHDAVKKHQETVINALKTERDVSVRQRAVDLLYAMCDRYVLQKKNSKFFFRISKKFYFDSFQNLF